MTITYDNHVYVSKAYIYWFFKVENYDGFNVLYSLKNKFCTIIVWCALPQIYVQFQTFSFRHDCHM